LTHRRRPSTRSGVPRSPTSPKADRSPCHRKQNLTHIRTGSQLTGLDRGGQREEDSEGRHSPSKAPREGRWETGATQRLTRVPHGRSTRVVYAATLAWLRGPDVGFTVQPSAAARPGLSFVATSTAASVRRRQWRLAERFLTWTLPAFRGFGAGAPPAFRGTEKPPIIGCV
jgi:hypothetical protein